jgi:glycosylphosphatidylinositol transamidase (GPIT) subunit GPI8
VHRRWADRVGPHIRAGEKSYSHHTDPDVGLTVTDRVTYHGLQWFNRVGATSNATLQEFLDYVGCVLGDHAFDYVDCLPDQ